MTHLREPLPRTARDVFLATLSALDGLLSLERFCNGRRLALLAQGRPEHTGTPNASSLAALEAAKEAALVLALECMDFAAIRQQTHMVLLSGQRLAANFVDVLCSIID